MVSFFKLLTIYIFTGVMSLFGLLAIPVNRNGRLFHWLARVFGKGIFLISRVKIEVKGVENLEKEKSYVYVANHASGFDIPAVLAGVPDQIRIVYKKELEKIPFLGWALKFNKTYIPIARDRSVQASRSLDEAVEKIKNGASVLLFGEGTRTMDGKLQPFKRGAFNLAVKAGVPVIPLTINGSYKAMSKQKLKIVPGIITLTIDKPIEVDIAGGKAEELRLMKDVHRIISNHYIDQ